MSWEDGRLIAAPTIIYNLYTRISTEAAVNRNAYTGNKSAVRFITKEKKSTVKLLCLAEAIHRSCSKNFLRTLCRRAILIPKKRFVLIC